MEKSTSTRGSSTFVRIPRCSFDAKLVSSSVSVVSQRTKNCRVRTTKSKTTARNRSNLSRSPRLAWFARSQVAICRFCHVAASATKNFCMMLQFFVGFVAAVDSHNLVGISAHKCLLATLSHWRKLFAADSPDSNTTEYWLENTVNDALHDIVKLYGQAYLGCISRKSCFLHAKYVDSCELFVCQRHCRRVRVIFCM